MTDSQILNSLQAPAQCRQRPNRITEPSTDSLLLSFLSKQSGATGERQANGTLPAERAQ